MNMISELVDGTRISGQFLINSSAKGTDLKGNPYINVDLKDSSGVINAKKWTLAPGDEDIFVAGNVIEITADVIKYKENLQLKIVTAKLVDTENIDTTRFLKEPPVSKEELRNRFDAYIESIEDQDCKNIVKEIIRRIGDKIYTHPAAVSIHHDYISGLLMHSVTMADIAEKVIPIYEANRDLLISGIILHDIGKVIELEGPAIFHYSLEGKLIGHISILSALIKEVANELKITGETPLLLQHMILSHHGNLEYGSPVLPLTKEAMLLSLIDNMDCKMVALNKALEITKPGEFTQRIFSLDGRMMYKHNK